MGSRQRSRRLKRSSILTEEEENPMTGVANLFDVAMVFSVALLVALVVSYNVTELMTQDDITIVKNPGKPNMQIIEKNGQEIKTLNQSNEIGGGTGKMMMGSLYELEGGKVIYVPNENATSSDTS